MITSPTVVKIVPALLAAKKQFKPALKTAENPHFKSRYVDLHGVVEATEDALLSHDLLLLQGASGDVDAKSVTITSRLLHASGEWIESSLTLPAGTQQRFDSQTVGSAVTYGRRYSYMALLGLSGEDDDGNVASGHASFKEQEKAHLAKFQEKAKREEEAFRQEHPGDAYESDEPLFDENGDLIEATSTKIHKIQKEQMAEECDVPSTIPANGPVITENQAKRFIAVALNKGRTWPQINAALKAIGVRKQTEIPVSQYDSFITWAGGTNEKRA